MTEQVKRDRQLKVLDELDRVQSDLRSHRGQALTDLDNYLAVLDYAVAESARLGAELRVLAAI